MEPSNTMQNLILTPWRTAFLDQIKQAQRSILLVSPFMKFNIVSMIHRELVSKNVSVRTITRCKLLDFAAGASDIDAVYALSGQEHSDRRFQLRIDNRLHAKIFIFDDEVAFIGSSNITFSGLQRNYEAVVQTNDPTFVKSLIEETDRYWGSAAPATEAMLSETLMQLRTFVRTKPVQQDKDEHYYEPPKQPELIDELPADQFDLNGPEIGAIVEEAEEVPAIETTPRLTGREETQNLSLREELDQFLETIRNRFAVSLPMGDYGLCAAAFILDYTAYNEAFESTNENALPGLPASKEQFNSLKGVGNGILALGLAMICVRSGILRGLGPAGAASFCDAATGRGLLDTLWDQNYLGMPWGQNRADLPRNAKAQALYRTLAVVAVEHGIERATDIVEEFFNPTDLLGDDVLNVIDLKDPKTLIQEATQRRRRSLSYGDHENAGSEHETIWRCVLKIGGAPTFPAEGKTKGASEQEAARKAARWMATDPTWRATLNELRQRTVEEINRAGPWRLTPRIPKTSMVTRVCETFRADTGLNLPDSVIFPAFVDRKVRLTLHLDENYEALAFLGAAIIQAAAQLHLFRSRQYNLADRMRRFYARIHEAMPIDGARNEIHIEREYSAGIRTTIIQAIIGGVAARISRSRAISIVDEMMDKLSLTQQPEGGTSSRLSTGFAVLTEHSPQYTKGGNYAETLQRFTQAFRGEMPAYAFVRSGPDHAPKFRAILTFKNYSVAADGTSKREARDRSSFELLSKLKEALVAETLREEDFRTKAEPDE